MLTVEGDGAGLTVATRAVWAKSRIDERGELTAWLPLHEHLADAADAAELLWDRWMGEQRRRVIEVAVGDPEQARRLAIFLAAVHDVGKATLPFAAKVPRLGDQMVAHAFTFPFRPTADDQRALPHGLAGQIIVERYLCNRGWARAAASQLGSVVGGHHGIPPSLGQVQHARTRSDLLGDDVWLRAQDELLDAAVRRSGVDLDALRARGLGSPALVLLTGLVIVADWLASNETLFPLARPEAQLPSRTGRAEAAWRRIDLPEPWVAQDSGADAGRLLAGRFGLLDGARSVQAAAVDAARGCDVPGVLVIEAPMGEGKTEAALLAAEILAARSGASGVLDALPTQATSNAMFARVLDWLGALPDAAVSHEARRRHAVVLAHGKAGLDATFRRLRTESRSTGIGVDEILDSVDLARRQEGASIDAYVHGWMTSPKKTPLADFMVATVDQLLFLALQARHLALRHLGLAGKVVIVDEVHAYDAYMGVYLRRALEWLGAYGCPVVLLSATLPAATRSQLLEAYRSGVAAMRPDDGARDEPESMFPTWSAPMAEDRPDEGTGARARTADDEPLAYPAVWALNDGEPVAEPVPSTARSSSVRLELAPDGLDTLVDLLDRALAEGGCALVVRNTVGRAQETFEHLVRRWGEHAVTLAHSRFLACDRAALDARLLEMFGPPGGDRQERHRPERHVVVATQVAEQSLDVDFDLLVTDLAPIDLVLQRMGRLHRHDRERPSRLTSPRCVVVGVDDWSSGPPEPVKGSQAVYGRFTLLQAAALLVGRAASCGTIRIPDDVAPWVAQAYGEADLGPAAWSDVVAAARREHDARAIEKEAQANSFRVQAPAGGVRSLNGWLDRSPGDVDESTQGKAQVRDSADSLEVLLLARDRHGVVRLPAWARLGDHAGQPVPVDSEPSNEQAVAIASCALRLPSSQSVGARGDALIDELGARWFFAAWQKVPELRGQLVMVLDEQPDGTLAGDVATRHFAYDPRTGLKVRSKTAEA